MARLLLLHTSLIAAMLSTAEAFVGTQGFPASSIWSKNVNAPASTTRCNLFFGTKKEKKEDSIMHRSLPKEVLQDLQSPSLDLPYTFRNSNDDNDEVTVRFLERRDLSTVVPMCVEEFGTTPAGGFPWKNINQRSILAWFDSIIFGPLVDLSLEMKILRRELGYNDAIPDAAPDYNVLCLETRGTVLAIVELSVQPLDPQRNPPPVPLPLVFKEAYSESKGVPPPNGWVSNLLVDESCRGKGYSKLLMTAAEGMAKQWGCTSISLHVDADSVSGKIPQRLYERLGYEPVVMDSVLNKFDWMGPDILKSGLYMVDGVPLLFLRKELI